MAMIAIQKMELKEQLHKSNPNMVKALSHDAIFFANCDAILPLGDVKLANTSFHHSLLIHF